MIAATVLRLRVLVALCRPPMIILFGLLTSLGLVTGGRADDGATAAAALVPVLAFLLFAVAVNDLSDEAVDRVNLPNDRGRPLASGLAGRHDMVVVAVVAATVALVGAAIVGPFVLALMVAGLGFALAYSLEPVRLARRGIVAPLALPLGYVAVPVVAGIFAARGRVEMRDLGILASAYVAFVGRLVLKDFRDVRGDALFGKRTFLVRHGRRAAIAVAGTCWVTGALGLAVASGSSVGALVAHAVLAGVTVVVLVALDRSTSARRDEGLIAAAAVLGRGTLSVAIVFGALRLAGWSAGASLLVVALVALSSLCIAWDRVVHGPRTRLVVPDWLTSLDGSGGRGDEADGCVAEAGVLVGARPLDRADDLDALDPIEQ